jgi:Tfp pilus assembly protein PilF
MSEQDHPVAGIIWLVAVGLAIGSGAKAGIEHSRRAKIRSDIREAVQTGERGNYAKAEGMLRDVVREHPGEPDALFNLGVAELGLERIDEADETFGKVLELNPSDWDAVAERATIAQRRGKTEQALSLLDRIPPGEGHIRDRLEGEVAWGDLDGDARMNKLRAKHGLPPTDPPQRSKAPAE